MRILGDMRRMGGATMTTDEKRQDIRHMTQTLSRRAAVLCMHMARLRTSLADQRARLAVHRCRLRELMHQQRRLLPASCPTQGRKRDTETVVLTDILSRLR